MADPKWQPVLPESALLKGWVTRATLGRRVIAVYDTPSGLYASLALCTHGGVDLCDGYFDGHLIECPLHQGAFDVRDGRAISPPATRTLRTLPVRLRDGHVEVQI